MKCNNKHTIKHGLNSESFVIIDDEFFVFKILLVIF
jgi:hypothetical protein